jgi:thiol-disulfide isomerase/thioredoxin
VKLTGPGRITAYGLMTLIAVTLVIRTLRPAEGGPLREPVPAPEFTHRSANEWINSTPLSLSDLRGKVVLVDFWTFDCWNCYRSFPWLKDMEARLGEKGLQVIGVHSPEFEREKVKANIVAKVKEFGLKHPVMIDTDFSYWHAMGNHYWPAYYLIDKHGSLRAVFVGETHKGDARAEAIESTIKALLAESA